MAIVQNTGSNLPITNIAYSATIGALLVRDPENEAKLNSVKAEIGDTEWKKGYQGPNSKAVQLARKAGLNGFRVTGALTSVRTREVEIDGRKTTYLSVGMKDTDGRYYISLDCGTESAHRLIRKLANAKPGVASEIGLWASMEDIRQGQARAYASHGAMLKQDGVEVPGVSPALELKGIVEQALAVLKEAGVDDKETLGRRRHKVTTDYHIGLANKTSASFAAYYEARGAAAQEDHVADEDYQVPPGMPEDLPPEAFSEDPFRF